MQYRSLNMAKEVQVNVHVDTIQKSLAQDKAILGTKRTLKQLRANAIATVYVSKTLSDEMKSDIEHYASLTQTPVEYLAMDNEELSVVCKKPFRISVVSIRK